MRHRETAEMRQHKGHKGGAPIFGRSEIRHKGHKGSALELFAERRCEEACYTRYTRVHKGVLPTSSPTKSAISIA